MKPRSISAPVLLAVLFSLPLAGATSLQLTGGTTLGFTIPNSAPYNRLGSIRYEFRIHNWRAPTSTYSAVFTATGFAIRFVPGQNTLLLNDMQDTFSSGQGNQLSVDLKGRVDFVIRMQRDVATKTLEAEVWNADGSNYAAVKIAIDGIGDANLSGPGLFGGPETSCRLAFFRWYSTLVSPNARPPFGSGAGDLADWRFNGTTSDTSGRGLKLSGRAIFAPTPGYPPVCNAGQQQSFASGAPAILDGSGSYSLDGTAGLSYLWQELSGPSTVIWKDPQIAQPSLTIADFGTYVFQLTVTDASGQASTCTVSHGAVSTDENGIVITNNPAIDSAIGPVTRWGSSPWPWYDAAERQNADALGSALAQDAWASAVSVKQGTVSIARRSTLLTGKDTHFVGDVPPGSWLYIMWDSPEGAGTGRFWVPVASVADDTHLTIDAGSGFLPKSSANVQYAVVTMTNPAVPPNQWGWGGFGGSDNWNYYDNVLAFYRVYYRTGIDTYLQYAHTLADRWWANALDHGFTIPLPRVAALAGVIARAIDGRPDMWSGIKHYMMYKNIVFTPSNYPTAANAYSQGQSVSVREEGYMLEYQAMVAKFAAQADGTADRKTRAAFCAYTHNAVMYKWAPAQLENGGYYENQYIQNPSYPYGGPGVVGWQLGVLASALHQAYEALNDPDGCNDGAGAQTALNVLKGVLDFMYLYGRDANRGQFYDENYFATGQDTKDGPGSLAGAKGSSTLVGKDTKFKSTFACNGSDFIGIASTASVYKVVSCQDDTHLTIDQRLPDAVAATCSGEPGSYAYVASCYRKAAGTSTDCAPSLADHCNSLDGAGRDRNMPIIGQYGYYYSVTCDNTYLERGDDLFSATYGGPADRSNGTQSGGPGADGNYSHYYVNALPPPAGQSVGGLVWGKAFGQGSGLGAAANYLGYRSAVCKAH